MSAKSRLDCLKSINTEISCLECELKLEKVRPLAMGIMPSSLLGSRVEEVTYKRIIPSISDKISNQPAFDLLNFDDILRKAEADAKSNAYHVIKHLMMFSRDDSQPLKIATAESLTGGMIFSMLVDVPVGGVHKYGAFGVYDTDAKRTFLGVGAPDVYTHLCAHEMAVGVLRNSNASVAISVTGNAMPLQGTSCNLEELKRLGEVFIGVAGYDSEGVICVSTQVYNFCEADYGGNAFAEAWYDTVVQENALSKVVSTLNDDQTGKLENFRGLMNGYNQYVCTALLSKFIRLQTAIQAYKDVCVFLQTAHLCVPLHIERTEIGDVVLGRLNASNDSVNLVLNSKRHGIKCRNVGIIRPDMPRTDDRDGSHCLDKFKSRGLP